MDLEFAHALTNPSVCDVIYFLMTDIQEVTLLFAYN